MDSMLIPILAGFILCSITVLVSILISLAYAKEQKRLEHLVSRMESLSRGRRSQLQRLRRFSRLNLYSNFQGLRKLDREITSIERNNGIHTSYRLRRLTLSADRILDNMEDRIGKLEKTLAASL
jgi:hypothetical protein